MNKFIFILFLFPIFCSGQMSKQDSVWIEKGKQELQEMVNLSKLGIAHLENPMIIGFDEKNEYGAVYLVDQIGKYIDWCYKDSTLLKHQHFMPDGETFCIVDFECLNKSHYRDIWTHKEPTFIGFYKWLKSKK